MLGDMSCGCTGLVGTQLGWLARTQICAQIATSSIMQFRGATARNQKCRQVRLASQAGNEALIHMREAGNAGCVTVAFYVQYLTDTAANGHRPSFI